MNRSLWMIAVLAGGLAFGLYGCGSQTAPTGTDADKTPTTSDGGAGDGSTTAPDDGQAGGGADSGSGTADDPMAGGDDPATDSMTDDPAMADDTAPAEPMIDEQDVLAVLGDGVQEDTAAGTSTPTTTTEDPFFGEDADLYDGVDLSEADDVDLGTLLDSDRAALGRGAAQAITPVVHGYLGGTTDSRGIMRGRWFDAAKVPSGAFRGEWVELSTDGEVRFGRFTAKYIDDDGGFQGFLRGRWAVGANGAGFFLGRWYDAGNQDLGILRGTWRDADTGGAFVGRWAGFDICAEAEDVDGDTQDTQSTNILSVLNGADVMAPVMSMDDQRDSAELVDVQVRGTVPCTAAGQPFGFLSGTHTAGTDNSPGTFTGHWVTAQGTVTGSLRGVYGPADVVSSIAVPLEDPTETAPQPQTVMVTPDDFDDGTRLTTVSPHVTLRTTVADGMIVGLFEITASTDGQGYAPSGTAVFGHADIPFFNNDRRMRMDFAHPASRVQITFGGGTFSQTEIGRLEAYNAMNERVGEYVTQPLAEGENEVMSIDRAAGDIAWAVAYIADGEGSFGRLDDLVFTFTEVPQDDGLVVQPPPPGTEFDGLGIFIGEIQNADGVVIGFLRGHYGTSARGLHVFRGRYLDAERNPRGFIKGRWTRPFDGTTGPLTGFWSGSAL